MADLTPEKVVRGLYPQGALFGDPNALRRLTDDDFRVEASAALSWALQSRAAVKLVIGTVLNEALIRWGNRKPYKQLLNDYASRLDVDTTTLWRWRTNQTPPLPPPAETRGEDREMQSSSTSNPGLVIDVIATESDLPTVTTGPIAQSAAQIPMDHPGPDPSSAAPGQPTPAAATPSSAPAEEPRSLRAECSTLITHIQSRSPEAMARVTTPAESVAMAAWFRRWEAALPFKREQPEPTAPVSAPRPARTLDRQDVQTMFKGGKR